MSAAECPDWCTVEGCEGGDCNRYQLPNIVASRSRPLVVDERGAIVPAVGVGIFGGEDSSRGTGISLTLGGVTEQLVDLEFAPDEAFELAIALLDTYRMVIQEVDKPAAPYPDVHSLRPIVETIEHNLMWGDRDIASVESRIDAMKTRLKTMDPEADADAYDSLFKRLIGLEGHRRELLTQDAEPEVSA